MRNAHLRHQLEPVWEAFRQVGMHDPGDILEQMLYLLFLRRLDGAPCGAVPAALRWEAFRSLPGADMLALLSDHVYPGLRVMGRPGAAYALHLKDVQLKIRSAPALVKIVALLDQLPRHPAGHDDAFDCVAGQLARLGGRDECHTPGPVERLMVALVAPVPGDVICSPVAGCGNFLVAAARHLRQYHPDVLAQRATSEHFHHRMFHGYDADKTMLRICCMRLMLEGLGNPAIRFSSVVPDIDPDGGRYSVILAHLPTVGVPGAADTEKRAHATGLMLAQFVRSLRPGGRAAVVVPGRSVTGATEAARKVRHLLTREQRLDALIPLPRMGADGGRPGRKSLLLLTRTDGGGRPAQLRTLHIPMPREARCGLCVVAR